MIPAQAVELILNALADLPSGPDPQSVLDAIRAEAWDEGYEQADSDAPHAIKSENPYRTEP